MQTLWGWVVKLVVCSVKERAAFIEIFLQHPFIFILVSVFVSLVFTTTP